MKVLSVHLGGAKQAKSKSGGKKGSKSMNFTEWVDHYVQMSKGNPV